LNLTLNQARTYEKYCKRTKWKNYLYTCFWFCCFATL